MERVIYPKLLWENLKIITFYSNMDLDLCSRFVIILNCLPSYFIIWLKIVFTIQQYTEQWPC